MRGRSDMDINVFKIRRRASHVAFYILAIALFIVFLSPFIVMVTTSFKTLDDAFTVPVKILPREWTFSNYGDAVERIPYWRYMGNTAYITLLSLMGELIVTNIYRIKRGDKVLKCTDYYTGEEREIPLDERLTPSGNSTAYFNRYNKLKRTKEFTEKKLAADLLLLDYVASLEEEIASLPYDAPSTAIEEELERLGAVRKKSKGKVRREKAEPPAEYIVGGFTVLAGKNNLQNDELTFRVASSSDLWLHLKNRHGAHVVVLAEGKTVPEEVIKVAAEIAAASAGANAEVDYTLRRYVKRRPSGHPGQVIYTDFKTTVARPDAHPELLKRKNAD